MFQILVVEDDNELRDLFCAVLTENGYTAVPAVDGIDAFDILDETYVDLIISDIMMPRMDGFELIKALREAHYNTPVLMITARSSAADKREGFRIGTDDYMVKPIDVNEMVWRVEALLRRSQIASQRRTKLGAPSEGVPPPVQAGGLSQPHIYEASAHGRYMGSGQRNGPPYSRRTY